MQRIRLLYKLIRDKQDINKKDFKNVLGSKRLFTHFGKKEINYSSPISYFKSLVAINGRKMLLTFLLSTISLLFTISTTLFNEYVIRPSMSADTFEFPQQL